MTSYRPAVFGFILASTRDRDAAESLTQDCFLKAYRNLDHFRHDCSLTTWLLRIAANLIRDRIRSREWTFWKSAAGKPIELFGDEIGDGELSQESKILFHEKLNAVWAAAECLTERQREVFLLRFVEDLDILQIVKETGMKEGTVKTHLSRAVRALREKLGVQQTQLARQTK